MPEFKPASGWGRGGGRVPTKIPPTLITWLKKTYETGTYCELPIGDDDLLKVQEVVKLARLACRRRQKSLQYEIDQEAGLLRIRMRDKRIYKPRMPKEDAA